MVPPRASTVCPRSLLTGAHGVQGALRSVPSTPSPTNSSAPLWALANALPRCSAPYSFVALRLRPSVSFHLRGPLPFLVSSTFTSVGTESTSTATLGIDAVTTMSQTSSVLYSLVSPPSQSTWCLHGSESPLFVVPVTFPAPLLAIGHAASDCDPPGDRLSTRSPSRFASGSGCACAACDHAYTHFAGLTRKLKQLNIVTIACTVVWSPSLESDAQARSSA